jgi:hypothetical protein
VHDLLNPDITQIRIQHDPKLGTVLSGVKEQVVMNPEQVSCWQAGRQGIDSETTLVHTPPRKHKSIPI